MISVINKHLICNYKRCNTVLTSSAWVSSCSHIFCDEHSPAYETDKKCPSCSIDLNGRYDLINNNLNPSEESKSMILAGWNPTNILEMGLKAMSFWTFQTFQERMYLTTLVKHLRSRLAQAECSYEKITEKLKGHIQQESQKCESLEKELTNFMRKTKDLEEQVEVKTRELINMHIKCETLQKQIGYTYRSDHLNLSQCSATNSRSREPRSPTVSSSQVKQPVRQVPPHMNQPKAMNRTHVSVSQPATPNNRMGQEQHHNKHYVFSYSHLPSKPSRLPFNFNPVTANQPVNTTPIRQSQTNRLFPD